MAGRDRRRHERRSFAQRGTFRWCGRTLEGELQNVSVTGGFLQAEDAPPIGARLTFTFEPNDVNQKQKRVEFQGEVTRSEGETEATGFAVRWIQARTYGTGRFLRGFLKSMFQLDMLVYERKTGHVAWTPAPRGSAIDAAVPRPPVDTRGPERAIAVVTSHMARSTPRPPVHMEDRLTPPPLPADALPRWARDPVAPSAMQASPVFEPDFSSLTDELTPTVNARMPRLVPSGNNVIQLVPQVGQERRTAERKETDARVHFRLNATTLSGEVHEISETGLWIVTDERRLPRVGDLLACRYPISELGNHDVRLVGKVVRQSADERSGFAIELVRVDDRGVPGAFRSHVDRLGPAVE
ncbi:MAG: hypothetical protein ACI9WU_004661 [Myxococcota bacterium]|jgi:hypothetical protein